MTASPSPKPEPGANRRKKTRYPISSDFRLKAVLALCGDASSSTSGAWKNWPGTLVDLSASGANVQVSLAAVAFPENPCRLHLSLGSFKLEIPGTVAHYVCSSRNSVCGVNFDFSYAGVEKSYHRVLEPVIVGASLAAGDSGFDSSGRHRETYRGQGHAELTIWREKTGGDVSGFDFVMGHYGVEVNRVSGDAASIKSSLCFKLGAAAGGSPGDAISHNQETEARWQFTLAASNLSMAVPADVRKFFLKIL